jgi:hypothetical protein
VSTETLRTTEPAADPAEVGQVMGQQAAAQWTACTYQPALPVDWNL